VVGGRNAVHAEPMHLNPKLIWNAWRNLAAVACALVLVAVEVGMAIVAVRYFAHTVASHHGASDSGSPGASATLDRCADWLPA
jgi:hypothetical protein